MQTITTTMELYLMILIGISSTLCTAADLGVPVFTPGEGGYPCIRVPAIASTSDGVLVAFAECRKYTGDGCVPNNNSYTDYNDDSDNRWICQKVSRDNGQTWSNLSFPFGLEHTSQNPTIVYDTINKRLILQSNVYIGQSNETIYQIQSSDNGATWTNVIDIGAALYAKYPTLDANNFWPGPSTGIQLKLNKKGRILFSGHTPDGAYIWYSDDFGETYQFAKNPSNDNNTIPNMEEGALAELSNGSLLLNSRNSNVWNCHCRGFSISNDYGESFGDAYPESELTSPGCQGSTISAGTENGKYMIFESNPDSEQDRVNMTVRKSVDDGDSWSVVFNPCPACGGAYSCMTTLPNDRNSIGLLWETNGTQCQQGSWACRTLFSIISVD